MFAFIWRRFRSNTHKFRKICDVYLYNELSLAYIRCESAEFISRIYGDFYGVYRDQYVRDWHLAKRLMSVRIGNISALIVFEHTTKPIKYNRCVRKTSRTFHTNTHAERIAHCIIRKYLIHIMCVRLARDTARDPFRTAYGCVFSYRVAGAHRRRKPIAYTIGVERRSPNSHTRNQCRQRRQQHHQHQPP